MNTRWGVCKSVTGHWVATPPGVMAISEYFDTWDAAMQFAYEGAR